MIRHVGGIAEIVEDVEAAATFYEGLGLEVERMPGEQGQDYGVVKVSGVVHFGLWNRAHAAESTYGSRDAADRVPLGFSLALEVDSVDVGVGALANVLLRGPQDEPWGQRTARFRSPSGALAEICETADARELASAT